MVRAGGGRVKIGPYFLALNPSDVLYFDRQEK